MPRQSNTVNRDELHPEGVALQPGATHPHEADPEPNTQETAEKVSRRERVNPDLIVDNFQVHDELPEDNSPSGRGNHGGQGRPMAENTLQALRFLRANAGKWVSVARFPKPQAPGGRLAFAGYFADDDGNAVEPTEAEERSTKGADYPIKKKIEYKFRDRQDDGSALLFLRLTDEDWTPPKKRAPKTDDVNTTTTDEVGAA